MEHETYVPSTKGLALNPDETLAHYFFVLKVKFTEEHATKAPEKE
jgi:hypothetical protein